LETNKLVLENKQLHREPVEREEIITPWRGWKQGKPKKKKKRKLDSQPSGLFKY
jgi:hypothetical protein